MNRAVTQGDQRFEGRLERERIHFNRMAQRAAANSLWMPEDNIQRYHNPPSTTPFPLEYAFHLLGPLESKTVLDLGCGDGLNTVILAALGAHVISVDISDESLRLTEERAKVNKVNRNVTLVHSDSAGIPIDANTADLVLCAAILHHVDCVATAKQIRRVLRSGGRAVFMEPLLGPVFFSAIKSVLPKAESVTDDERPLTHTQIADVSRSVGIHGRSRIFGLTMRGVTRFGIASWPIINTSHRFDDWILRKLPFLSSLASPLVWEATKQSEAERQD